MPPVDIVLLRGLAREAAHWGEFIPLLESQKWVHSVHAIDLLGMGQFYKLTAPLSIAENAEFVISQLPVKKERHRVLVAISLGGMVAVEICQKKPESIDQAFVINSSFSNLSPLQQRLQLSAWKRFVKIGRAQDTLLQELEVLQMVSRRTDKHEEIAKQWVEIAKKRPIRKDNFFRQLIAAARYNLSEFKPRVPITVLSSKGDQMVHPSCSEALAEHWDLPIITHPSAGHDLGIDDPEWLVKTIGDHLIS